MDLDRYTRWQPDPDVVEAAESIRADAGDQAAAAYLAVGRPGFAVITAGYANPAEALGGPLGPGVPHWSGVFYFPFRKGEIVVLSGDADGREPEDDQHPCQRRPAKWPLRVEWFGQDLAAARRRSVEVACSRAVAIDPEDPDAEPQPVPVVMATCAWCGTTANRASMEPINSVSVACRNVHECQRRIDGAEAGE